MAKLSPTARLNAIAAVYCAAVSASETLCTKELGTDVAYLLGAIATEQKVDWRVREGVQLPHLPALYFILRESVPDTDPVWNFILLDKADVPESARARIARAQKVIQEIPGTPFSSAKAYYAAVERHLQHNGFNPVAATYDPAGNCTCCGEAGRCPGWHIPEEIELAAANQQSVTS